MSRSLFELTGKIALVTGGSRGLGRGFANALARAGADVAVSSRTLGALEDTVKEIEATGRSAFGVGLDVGSEASIREAVAKVEAHFGRIDILVNNAGCNVRKPATDVTWEDWNKVLDTNLRGPFFVSQAVARGDDRAWRRADHQHGIRHGGCGLRRIGSVRSKPRWRASAHDEPGGRLGTARGHRKLSCPWLVQDCAKFSDVRRRRVGGRVDLEDPAPPPRGSEVISTER